MSLYQHQVQYYETDKMGITHHSNYIRWMEESRIHFLSEIGWDYNKLEEIGIISPVTGIDCKYKVSTTFADIININVWVEELRPARLKVGYEMKKDDIIVCEGFSEHCFLNKEGKIINLKREYCEFYNDLLSHVKDS